MTELKESQAAPVDAESIEEIEKRYREERAKRLRKDGNKQYMEIAPGSELEADPFVTEIDTRGPIVKTVDTVVLGGGLSGLMMAVQLEKHGVEDYVILEKGADFGGTWYWNRYPGLHCDVESYIYLPFLEELGYVPSKRYTAGQENLAYARRIAEHWSLYGKAYFQTRVTDATWNESSSRWDIRTNRGDVFSAHFLVLGTGGLLHRPKLPGIPGLDTFRGKTFHTSRWDYSYTGGDPDKPLTGLSDKRVAVIGTGATAIQVIPKVAETAAQLYVFQRTPVAVDFRANAPTDEEWFGSLEAGWQAKRMANFDCLLAGIPQEENLVADQWSEVWGFPDMVIDPDTGQPDMAKFMASVHENDHQQMSRIRAQVDAKVADPDTAEALKPWFATHCKRPGFHDRYLETFNKPNVRLVDTNGRGVDAMDETGLVFDGEHYDVDCIIYATGFEATVSPGRAGGFPIHGRGGLELEARWNKHFRTVHGILTAEFPNLFVVGGIRGAAASINVPYVNGLQAEHVAQVLKSLADKGATLIEVSEAAEEDWQNELISHANFDAEATRSCTPGYYNNEGHVDDGNLDSPLFHTVFGGGPVVYMDLLTKWRSGLEDSDKLTVR